MGWGWGMRNKEKPIPDPGLKKAPDPGSGSPTLFIRSLTAFSHLLRRFKTDLESRMSLQLLNNALPLSESRGRAARRQSTANWSPHMVLICQTGQLLEYPYLKNKEVYLFFIMFHLPINKSNLLTVIWIRIQPFC
jgi:hypothetical protein